MPHDLASRAAQRQKQENDTGVRASGLSAGELEQVRPRLGRWVVLALELAVGKARGVMDSEALRDYLGQLPVK